MGASIAGAQSSDSILSKHIREADGATGQDTNNGAGIKTNHIQNGAVTAAKLAPASVDTAAVADGAITAAKIASPLPASIINRTGLDADSVDGYHAGDFSPIMHNHVPSEILGLDAYQLLNRNVIVVAKDGSGNFTDPAQAVAWITNASASNPYLVKAMPGEYTTTSVTLKPFVDLEGSGQGVTQVVMPAGQALDVPASSEVRDLTVRCEGCFVYASGSPGAPARFSRATIRQTVAYPGGSNFRLITVYDTAIFDGATIVIDPPPGEGASSDAILAAGTSTTVRNSTIRIGGGTVYAKAITLAIGDLFVENSQISTAGSYDAWGIFNNGGTASLRNSTVLSKGGGGWSFGTYTSAGQTLIEGSSLVAAGSAGNAAAWNTAGLTYLASTRTQGSLGGSAGTFRCIAIYDQGFAPVTCP